MEVLEKLQEYTNSINGPDAPTKTLKGFPKVISILKSEKKYEILLKAHGPNLRSLLQQIPGERFSRTSIYKIIIQLVSYLFWIILFRSNVSKFCTNWAMFTMTLSQQTFSLGSKTPASYTLSTLEFLTGFWEAMELTFSPSSNHSS